MISLFTFVTKNQQTAGFEKKRPANQDKPLDGHYISVSWTGTKLGPIMYFVNKHFICRPWVKLDFISKQIQLELSQSGIGFVRGWILGRLKLVLFTNFMKPSQGISVLSQPLVKKNSYLNFHEIGQKTLLLPKFLLFVN